MKHLQAAIMGSSFPWKFTSYNHGNKTEGHYLMIYLKKEILETYMTLRMVYDAEEFAAYFLTLI